MRDLEEELGAPLPAGIAALTEEHRTMLAAALAAERRRQHEALDHAIEAGLGFLPRVLRVAVRKALLG